MANTLKYLGVLILLVIIMVVYYFLPTNIFPDPQACINSKCFNIELAQTLEARQTGLMSVSSLPQDQGMLFIFPSESKHSFWMKNTLIPLDIIWINSQKKIVHIESSVQPCTQDPCPTYAPNFPAKYVLEINADLAQKHSFELSDPVEIKLQ